jgi:deoxyribose-phosphate aldolase
MKGKKLQLIARKSDEETLSVSEKLAESEQKQFDEFKHLRRIEGAKALITKVELDLAYVSVDKDTLKSACREANALGIGAVCVLPCFVKACVNFLGKDPQASLISVISYPAGADVTEVKVHALKCAVADGIDEAIITAPMAYIKEGNWGYVKKQFKKIRKASRGRAVRILIECSFLSPQEVLKASQMVADVGLNGVVLSCYAVQKAVPFDLVRKVTASLKDRCFVSVSGVSSRDDMSRYIDAGAQTVCGRDGLTLAHLILAAAE